MNRLQLTPRAFFLDSNLIGLQRPEKKKKKKNTICYEVDGNANAESIKLECSPKKKRMDGDFFYETRRASRRPSGGADFRRFGVGQYL